MLFANDRIADAWLFDGKPRGDERDMSARAFCTEAFARSGLATSEPQMNAKVSAKAGPGAAFMPQGEHAGLCPDRRPTNR